VPFRTLRPMLAEMRIQGLGVIDDATLELDAGLTVLTGETGAGKTMVVTGLSLLGGGRAEASRVADGAKRAVVEGRFSADPTAMKVADEVGAEADDDGTLIAVRTVGADGRSRAHLGGRSVPVGVLGRLAEATLAVHGQNDQLRLLRQAEQRALLDRFAGDAVTVPLERYRVVRAEWQRVAAELVERRDGARRLAQEADLLRHGLTEIGSVDPQPGEDVELVEQARRLSAADDLREVASAAHAALIGAEDGGDPDVPGALALIGDARHRLTGADDSELTALDARLSEALALLGDVGTELTGYLERLDADPERLATVLSRQSELKALTRKYAADVDGVLAWADSARERLESLDVSDEALAALAARRDELAVELGEHAAVVTAARTEAAARLAADTTAELSGLAMGDARLLVAVSPREAGPGAADALRVGTAQLVAGTDGVDEVELRLVAHAGAAPQPLHKGASGGELSRVMLALEVALAGADPVPTMVFDEVDAGVGGRAAVEIGRRLARLAARHQVIVVTHLPQVAAYADRHLVVDKSQRGGNGAARSIVRTLAEGDRIVELARMLAGLDHTDTGRAHAEELLGAARAHREADRAAASPARKPRKKAPART
jgi:DNA repair protein RecN (Recombination protein N)